MNYKEKYEYALECIQEILNSAGDSIKTSILRKRLQPFFPQLKESEDENIKKKLKHYLEVRRCQTNDDEEYINCNHFLAWVEKQGESDETKAKMFLINKGYPIDTNGIFPTYDEMFNIIREGLEKQAEGNPADMVEPKFHPGDWIVDDETPNDVFCVIEVLEEIYKVIDIDGNDYHIPHCKADKQFHLWTIQDAKDGDVLATKNSVFIFKYMDKSGLSLCKSYCEVIGNSELGVGFNFSINGVYPATKEQRNFLFQKMKDAGYKFDFEKKELKTIEQNLVDNVEPKFHNTSNLLYRVDSILFPQSKCYYLSHNGGIVLVSFNDEQNYHLWTIDDANDGDVLCYENKNDFKVFIYKNGHIHYHCCYSNGHLTPIDSFFILQKHLLCYIQPATKEQRDLLFCKMKEAGYEWDSEKMEVASEKNEDEEIRKALIDYFDDANKSDKNPLQSYGTQTDKVIVWLEKQKGSKEKGEISTFVNV